MDDHIDESSMSLIDHLAELRTRLIRATLAFVIAMMLCFTVWQPIFNFLTNPICDALAARNQSCSLQLIELQEGFMTAIRISIFGGFALSFPMIGYQLWRFVAPGLYRQEKAAFLPFLIASPVMFFIGALFAYFIVLPLAFNFFLGFQQGQVAATGEIAGEGASIAFQGSMAKYLSLTMMFVAAFGMCFQLPVLLTLLGKADLVSSAGLANTRKYAVVAIMVLAAVVTPPDVITQLILFTVVYGLYEVSIFLVKRVEKERNKRLREDGYIFDEDEDYEADFEAQAAKMDRDE